MIKHVGKALPNVLRSFHLEPSIYRSAQSLHSSKWHPKKPTIRQQGVFQGMLLKLLRLVYLFSSQQRSIILRIKSVTKQTGHCVDSMRCWIKKPSRLIMVCLIPVLLQSHPIAAARARQIEFWDTHEMIIFYKSSCSHCKQFGPVLHAMIEQLHVPTINFTLDGASDTSYQDTARILPLLDEIYTPLSWNNSVNATRAVLQALLKNNRARDLPLIFIVSITGNVVLVSSGVMRSDRWLHQLLNAMQVMAQQESAYAT